MNEAESRGLGWKLIVEQQPKIAYIKQEEIWEHKKHDVDSKQNHMGERSLVEPI